MVELFKTEVLNAYKEDKFDLYLNNLKINFTAEDLKYVDKVKEEIYKEEV